jgi:amidase
VPAHFTGVTALKPSLGLVPSRGHAPLLRENDLAVVGPMVRTAGDVALLFEAIAEPDELTTGVGYRLALRPLRHEQLARHRVLMIDSHSLYGGFRRRRGTGLDHRRVGGHSRRSSGQRRMALRIRHV